jgi:hypothetical protein
MRNVPSTYLVKLYKLLNPTYIRLLIAGLLLLASFVFPEIAAACDMSGSGGSSCGGGLR